jgi:hypothetical protein
MRLVFSRVAALLVFVSLFAAGARAQEPVVAAWIGTPTTTSKVGYFVLDFDDPGPNPEVYTFGYYYEGTPTGRDFILALEGALTGANGFRQTGAANNFLTRLGYNGRAKFNDFAGNNSGDPNGFWNLWLGFDGLSWTSAQFGAADVTLSDTPVFRRNPFSGTDELAGAKWHGWRWLPDFTTGTARAPRPAFTVGSANAPEPSVALLVGLGGLLVVAARGRRGARRW